MPTNLDKNFNELCYSCRIGDSENVDRLVSTGVNVNGVDEFDNSPLFLASLCGHEEVVKLLLKRGAVCDRDRYEGARCIYGALTDSIRNTLLKYDISKAVDINQPFATHISSLLKNSNLNNQDISFEFHDNKVFKLHRFLLASRSKYFYQKLTTSWNSKSFIEMPEGTPSSSFETIIKFVYLVPILHEISPQEHGILKAFTKKLDIPELAEYLGKVRHVLDPSEKSALIADYQFKFTENAREQLHSFVEDYIIGQKYYFQNCDTITETELRKIKNSSALPDVFIMIKSDRNHGGWLYPCHRAILTRSEYFKTMFTSPFLEASTYSRTIHEVTNRQERFPIITLPTSSSELADIILRYFYYDSTEIPWKYAINVLIVADALLTERLKTMAAITITQSKEILEHYSIFDVLYVAWDTRVERLEHYAAEIIAKDLKHYCKDSELRKAIIKSSQRITVREETDTIELVDDIRYYLLKKHDLQPGDSELIDTEDNLEFLVSPEIQHYKEDLGLIEDILNNLGLDA